MNSLKTIQEFSRTPENIQERPFGLQCQQPENDKQNVDVAPLGKISADPVATLTFSASFHVLVTSG